MQPERLVAVHTGVVLDHEQAVAAVGCALGVDERSLAAVHAATAENRPLRRVELQVGADAAREGHCGKGEHGEGARPRDMQQPPPASSRNMTTEGGM